MRIYFETMDLPKRAAKRVKKQFTPVLPTAVSTMQLHHAQEITAEMLGYSTWYELLKITKAANNPPSLLDEECSPEEQARRLNYQTEILGRYTPVNGPSLRRMALIIRASAGAPNSTKFAVDAYRKNHVVSWTPPGEKMEWRFMPSLRSEEMTEHINELLDCLELGKIDSEHFKKEQIKIIEEQPENLSAYIFLLNILDETGRLNEAEWVLPKLQTAIIESLPTNFPKRGKANFNWWRFENRDFLRAIYYMCAIHFELKEYRKTKKWIVFLRRVCKQTIGEEDKFTTYIKSNLSGQEQLDVL